MSTKPIYIERDVLRLAGEGDPAAFSTLFNDYKYKLFGFMYKLTGSVELTEDIIQEVFLKLWSEREILPSIDNFNAYIFRMARNQAINGFKKMARETLALKELLNEAGAHSMADEQMSAKEIQNLLDKAIRELPPQQQIVFRLSREEGLKHEEIAEKLNISPGTVKNHMIQALRRLREHIRDHGDAAAAITAFLLIVDAFEK